MLKIDSSYVDNVMAAVKSPSAPASCTSAIFAGICKKIASFYADLYFVRWSDARNDYRRSKEYCVAMQDKFYEWQDQAQNWQWRYEELTSTRRAKTAAERRRLRKNHLTFERLLFKHWDDKEGMWHFSNYIFG